MIDCLANRDISARGWLVMTQQITVIVPIIPKACRRSHILDYKNSSVNFGNSAARPQKANKTLTF